MSFSRTLVTFESDYSLLESIERLSASTRRPSFSGRSVQAAVGKVEARRVWLVRSIPYVSNSFAPIFKGAFEELDGRVVLRGSFGMHVVVKVFMCVWFGGLIAMTVPIALREPGHSNAWIGVFAALGMSVLGLGVVTAGKWFARNDEAWLSAVIRGALTHSRR